MRANWVISTELGQNFFYLASPRSSLNYSAQVYITLQTKVKLNVWGMSTKYWFIVLFNGFAAAAARITSCIIKVTAQLGCRDTGTWLGNVTSGGHLVEGHCPSVQVFIEPLVSGWTLDSGQCPSTSCSLETNVTFLNFTFCTIFNYGFK